MLVTPFHDDYRLNEDALRREVQWAIAAGAHGVVAAPSIGEFLHMDEAERTRVFEIVIEETRKRPNLSRRRDDLGRDHARDSALRENRGAPRLRRAAGDPAVLLAMR